MGRAKKRRYIIYEDGKFRSFWNVVVVILLMYTATYVPYKLAFVENDSAFVNGFEIFVDCLFTLDIVFNFLTTYDDPATNTTISDLPRIAVNYLKGWFLLDVLACFPFQVLDDAGGSSSN